jgi:hypothetical protein
MTGRQPKGGFEWHVASDPAPGVTAGHSAAWGWILSPGPTPLKPGLADPAPWIARAHDFLTEKARRDRSQDGTSSMMDVLPELWRGMHDAVSQVAPDLCEKTMLDAQRPWIDAALVGLRRTRAGLELRYATAGSMTLGLHSGITDRWVPAVGAEWSRRELALLCKSMGTSGFAGVAGSAACEHWLSTCRERANQQGGPSAWLLGQQMGRGWVTGSIHISETPFAAALFNSGASRLVDSFHVYGSDKALFDYIRSHKRMDILVNKLRDAERQDPKGKLHPRPMLETPIGILSVQGT